jgi:ATP/ADP translocase
MKQRTLYISRRSRDKKRLKEVSMILVWIKASQRPLLLLVAVLLMGTLIVLVDFWQVRNNGLRRATSSRFRDLLRAQLGIALVSSGVSAFLFISPLTPQSWHSKEGFVIGLCFLYILLVCLRLMWRIIWIQKGF